MDNNERNLNRFVSDPTYREEMLEKIHKQQDRQYARRIRSLQSQKARLISARKKQIARISKARWESLFDGKLFVNKTEGKVRINKAEFMFSDILGAELNVQIIYRVVTKGKGKSKKHASLGGAVLGAATTLSPAGALLGGVGLASTTSQGTSVHDQIPICTHLGVLVNINGFVSEITVLSKQVEQESSEYVKAESEAQSIISKLIELTRTPVPTACVNVEDEPIVKDYDARIEEKESEILVAIDDKPTYSIPTIYRTEAQKDMSDEEYLEYLSREDAYRGVSVKQFTFKKVMKRVLPIALEVGCWIVSIFALVLVVIVASQSKMPSTILFLGAALSANPLVYRFIKSKWQNARVWIFVLACIGSFIVGIAGLQPVEEKPQSVSVEIIELI